MFKSGFSSQWNGYQARAKAEAARAQLAFAKKEAEMMKEEAYIVEEAARKKAELKANLHTLQLLLQKQRCWRQPLRKSSQVKVCFIVNSATCTVHTYRELKLRYSLTPWCIQITLNTNSRRQKYR